MADKRMIARSVIDNDRFMSMPLSAQALYFHMSLRADDDGFIGNLGALGRMLMAQESDLQALIDGGFVLEFEDGVAAIAHWRMHNSIKKDRYKATVYTKEMEAIEQDGNGVYSIRQDKPAERPEEPEEQNRPGDSLEPTRNQNGDSPETNRSQTGDSPETAWCQPGDSPETNRSRTGDSPETNRRQPGDSPETTRSQPGDSPETVWSQPGDTGKDRIGKDSLDKGREEEYILAEREVTEALNAGAGTSFLPSAPHNVRRIGELLDSGHTLEQLLAVTETACKKWRGTEKAGLLRPSFLFGKHFQELLAGDINAPRAPYKITAAHIMDSRAPTNEDVFCDLSQLEL
ncbi:MAG: conserved phage C-terminal domain-containing protein [Firmicutes bacterium]|nr:conserved phage C-terminal domain-containing protein [Bacillota bacterium]